jgi:hypothetical protein
MVGVWVLVVCDAFACGEEKKRSLPRKGFGLFLGLSAQCAEAKPEISLPHLQGNNIRDILRLGGNRGKSWRTKENRSILKLILDAGGSGVRDRGAVVEHGGEDPAAD